MEISDRGIRVRLNPQFYTKKCVDEALIDFAQVCTGTFEGNILTLRPREDNDKEKIAREFLNYVLALMKNTGAV